MTEVIDAYVRRSLETFTATWTKRYNLIHRSFEEIRQMLTDFERRLLVLEGTFHDLDEGPGPDDGGREDVRTLQEDGTATQLELPLEKEDDGQGDFS